MDDFPGTKGCSYHLRFEQIQFSWANDNINYGNFGPRIQRSSMCLFPHNKGIRCES